MTHPLDPRAFASLRVVVVGDLIADHYVEGAPSRVSREAPVLVLAHRSERWCAGGAANVARNAAALGAQCRVLGVLGDDRGAHELLDLLHADGVDAQGVEVIGDWQTPTKMRVLAGDSHRTPQQVLRIDREPSAPAPADARAAVCERIAALAGEVDVVLVSDYGYGLLDGPLRSAVGKVARAGARVVLDPRVDVRGFERLDAVTPNVEELARLGATRIAESMDREAIVCAAINLGRAARADHVLATLGNRGMALVDPHSGDVDWVDASGAERVVDVSGAGDTAAAVFALGLAAGFGAGTAMRVANAAAGLVVMRMGTAVPDLAELRAVLGASGLAVHGVRGG